MTENRNKTSLLKRFNLVGKRAVKKPLIAEKPDFLMKKIAEEHNKESAPPPMPPKMPDGLIANMSLNDLGIKSRAVTSDETKPLKSHSIIKPKPENSNPELLKQLSAQLEKIRARVDESPENKEGVVPEKIKTETLEKRVPQHNSQIQSNAQKKLESPKLNSISQPQKTISNKPPEDFLKQLKQTLEERKKHGTYAEKIASEPKNQERGL